MGSRGRLDMIWTIAMLHSVERLGVSMDLNRMSMDLAHADVKAGFQQEMSKRLVSFAHPLGVEINPEDVAFREVEEPFRLRVYARWAPSTTVVEFRGGQADGQMMTVSPQLLRLPIRIPQLLPVRFEREEDGSYLSSSLLTEHLEYELAGWHETQRHWIYDATSAC